MYHKRGERFTDQCVYVFDSFGGGCVMAWAGIGHDGRTQLKIVTGTLSVVKNRDDILDPIVLPFLQQRNFDHVFQHDNARCHMARVCQDFLNQNHIRALPWPALYHRICHQLNIYRMNSVDVFAIVKIQQNHYRGCVTHLIDWFYASEMRSCRCCKRWSHTLLNFRKPPHCMTISVCP